ncbi:hypothetical protein GCM10007269_19610 [Microbacterium murale]|uniref:Uncharacterized protein n=1 Tax=Microbacterium murale TaxID=1081040 RepID=A0ABQ1RSK0_9MICO|nr:hypothetical protein GCM10007269_19610 [Microbacterium murale]
MRIAIITATSAVLAITLTGCSGPSLEASCTALISGATKSVLTVRNLLTSDPIGATSIETAAAEVEDHIDPLREITMDQEVSPLRDSLVADADTILVAVRALNLDNITLTLQNMEKTAVDIDLACR